MKKVFGFISLFVISLSLHSQVIHDLRQSVIIETEVVDSLSILLRWMADDEAQSFNIYRKSPGSTFWGFPLASLPADSTNWVDSDIEKGIIYEYRIEKVLDGPNSNGFLYGGIKVSPVFYNGLCILVIDSFYKQSLEWEITRLVKDMKDEGWLVEITYCSEEDSPPLIRNNIIEIYNNNPNLPLYTVLLLGRVPVPYSGNIFPDGHPDHQGAWPADGYYGSISGNWTDQSVNVTVASDPRNHNIPGDGKFDQNVFPGLLQLAVGRVDFSRLPAFSESEEELLRKYLEKNHLWRRGNITTVERGLVLNNFGGISEGFGQNGYKNFAPMFGIDSVHTLPYRSTLQNEAYLWSYGAGPGNPSGAGGIINTSNLSTDSIQTVFTMLFGSYFGDWGYSNNLLRAALASGTVLTNVWAGRPNWQFHHMAMGKPIGYSVLKSKNNSSVYQAGFFPRGVHMALMGDPTLNMYIVSPPQQLEISQNESSLIINWSSTPNAEGYYLFSRSSEEEMFLLVNENIITDTFFILDCPAPGNLEYLIRASELKTTASGSFYLLSPGISKEFEANLIDFLPESNFEVEILFDHLSVENFSQNANQFLWDLGDGTLDSAFSLVHLYEIAGNIELCLQASNQCYDSILCKEIEIINSMPEVDAEINHIQCYANADGQISILLSGGAPDPELVWSNGSEESEISQLSSGLYFLTISTITGKVEEFGPWEIIEPDSLSIEFHAIYPDDTQDGSISALVSGGNFPYLYSWSNGDSTFAIENLSSGLYCLTVTDQNDCAKEKCYLLESTSVDDIEENDGIMVFPNPATDLIVIHLKYPLEKNSTIKIHDTKGSLIKSLIFPAGQKTMQINIQDLHSGTYYLNMDIRGALRTYSLNKK